MRREEILFDSLLGQPITVEVPPRSRQEAYQRVVSKRRAGRTRRDVHPVPARPRPEPSLLTRKTQSRIFQHITVPDILKKVLTGLDVTWEIQGPFEPRDYCVQYRETDFDFASRLMEEEGIYYFFKHSDGSHTMVVANTPGSHSDSAGREQADLRGRRGGTREEDRI